MPSHIHEHIHKQLYTYTYLYKSIDTLELVAWLAVGERILHNASATYSILGGSARTNSGQRCAN